MAKQKTIIPKVPETLKQYEKTKQVLSVYEKTKQFFKNLTKFN